MPSNALADLIPHEISGDKDHPADAVFIRTVNENEVKKKLAKKKQKTEQ